MEVVLIAGLLIVNFGISWWNAKVAGMIWLETKSQGGFMRLVAWSAAIQSAFGFTTVFAVFLGGLAFVLHLVKAAAPDAIMDLTYLLVVVPLLGSGIIITIHSYVAACQSRSPWTAGVAAWNTWSLTSDFADAVEGVCDAFADLMCFMDGDSDQDGISLAAVLTVVTLCLGGGITLTYAVVRSNLLEHPVPAA